VFSDLGEKPVIERAQLLGSAKAKGIRAVRVKLRNRIAALSVVKKAPLLKGSTDFIAPDRTPEERVKQRELVEEVARRRAHNGDDFHRRHYIRNGEVVSVDRPWDQLHKDGLERPK
tara:strand:+ start:753 stop:1100 length:348 start_codon:yes stop_codon:yes gene_type:complete